MMILRWQLRKILLRRIKWLLGIQFQKQRLFLNLSPLLFIILLFSETSFAKEMQGRLGLGYNSEFANLNEANGVPAVSIKYGLSRDLGMEGAFGIATTNPSNSVAAVKFFKNIFFETNLNFYFMLGGGLITADSHSGAELLSGFGAEFFIPGIESLGFAMEVGASLDNASGGFAAKTLGVSFLNAGIHFYF